MTVRLTSRLPLRPARASLAALLTTTLLLAGCGDGDTGGSEDDKPGDTTSSDTSDGSADESTDDSSSGSAPAGDLTTENFYEEIIRAQRDAGSYRSTSTSTTAGVSSVLEGEATYEGDALLGHAKSTADSPQQVETVVADGVLYLKGEGLGAPAGKWLKLDPEDPANAGSPLVGLAAVADPELALEAMGELDSLELVGPETIDGVEANHYRATMLTANYAKVLGLPADAADILPAKLPFDMWVDEDNRPVRFSLSFEVEGIRSETEQNYFDYGADIEVTIPADGDTVTPAEAGIPQG